MTPEELSKAIREGINGSVQDICDNIMKAIYIFLAIFVVFFVVSFIISKFELNKLCPDGDCEEATMGPVENCDKPKVYCSVSDDLDLGRSTGESISFCGYEEAQALFEMANIRENNFTVECRY